MKKLAPEDARQGRRGRPVLLVLIGGLALAGAAALVLHPYKQDAGTLKEMSPIEDTTATG